MAASEDRMERDEARGFLESLLNKKLRIHTTDERMFWGEFKCTDPVSHALSLYQSSGAWRGHSADSLQDRNIVLAHTYEYRQPSPEQRAKAAAALSVDATTIKMELTHRYLGLVVVPGEHIARIEKEDFASQVKKE